MHSLAISPNRPIVTALQDQLWFSPVRGERLTVLVTSAHTEGACSVLESIAAPMSGPPMHVHEHDDEAFHVLDGTLRFHCGDEVFDAPAGTSVTIPRGLAHTWQNRTDTPTRVLVTFTPGRMERLFEVMEGRPIHEIAGLAARFDTFIVGPPIGEEP
jgi:quercetin dioxygenase-like cupin family protein